MGKIWHNNKNTSLGCRHEVSRSHFHELNRQEYGTCSNCGARVVRDAWFRSCGILGKWERVGESVSVPYDLAPVDASNAKGTQ